MLMVIGWGQRGGSVGRRGVRVLESVVRVMRPPAGSGVQGLGGRRRGQTRLVIESESVRTLQ